MADGSHCMCSITLLSWYNNRLLASCTEKYINEDFKMQTNCDVVHQHNFKIDRGSVEKDIYHVLSFCPCIPSIS